jgi:peroxiredoxin
MSKSNNNSNFVTIAITAAVTLGVGYFLFSTSPDKSAPSQAAVDPMRGGTARPVSADQLNSLVGKPMPTINLLDKDGNVYTPESWKGKYTVLFFNEGLMCYPACWNQIAAFGADERFNSSTVQAISVVVDSATDWQRAIAKMPQLAKATTMFDASANASRSLGLLTTNSSMHKGALPGHSYILIDPEGVVRYVADDANMAIANNSIYKKIEELNK